MYGIGYRVLRSLCAAQNPLGWQKAKLSPELFKPNEQAAYVWVQNHLAEHHHLPSLDILLEKWPDAKDVETPDPPSFYLKLLADSAAYALIGAALEKVPKILNADNSAIDAARGVFQDTVRDLTRMQFRRQIIDVPNDAFSSAVSAYKAKQFSSKVAGFGWPYMDDQSGGVFEGDVISFVGRPAMGKTWGMLWTAIHNWLGGQNVLFASMEMDALSILQRLCAMYTKLPVGQLKAAQFADQTWKKFLDRLHVIKNEKAKMYIVDGKLAATVPEIYELARMLECRVVLFDGAYLLKHHNPRLDRFTRVAENVEMMKMLSADYFCTFASWQFNREASKKNQNPKAKVQVNLEDIAYSDAIGQISSIALGMFQEESIETSAKRDIRVMKGRNGEQGQFSIHWNFYVMDFSQADPAPATYVDKEGPSEYL